MESLAQLFVVSLEDVNPGFTARNCDEQLRVSLLSLLESPDHSLDIGDSSCCLDLLEGVIHLLRRAHLFLHLLSHKVVPELVDVEDVSHFEFR